MLIVAVGCGLFYAFVHFVRLCGFVSSFTRYRAVRSGDAEPARTQPAHHSAGVTVLRPMKGADSELRACLRSAFLQTWRPLQILMCCADADDDAVAVAERLVAEFPDVDAEVLVGGAYIGVNPKICNLVQGYTRAKHDKIWVLDANVAVAPSALARAVPLFSDRVALVHHLPVVLAGPHAGWGGRLDDVYMGTVHALFYAGINGFAIAPCVMGKSNIFSRKALDIAVSASPGEGLQYFARYLPEDHMIAEALWKAGKRTELAPDVVVQPLASDTSVREYWLRRVRWIRLRKYMVISATLVEPFTDCFFATAFVCIGASLQLRWFFILSILWLACDYANYRLLFAKANARGQRLWQFVLVWLLRETSAFPLWVVAISGRRVYWRNREYRIHPDLVAEEL